MRRVVLSQLTSQPHRYIAVLLAIIIGSTFLTASFLVGDSSRATLREMLGASYQNADLVIQATNDSATGESESDPSYQFARLAGTAAQPGPLEQTTGVEAAYANVLAVAGLETPGGDTLDAIVAPLPKELTLAGTELRDGTLPDAAGGDSVAIDDATAERHGIAVGDTLTLRDLEGNPVEVTVTGIVSQSVDPMMSSYPQVWGGEGLYARLDPAGGDLAQQYASMVLIRTESGADQETVRSELRSQLDAEGLTVFIGTPDEAVSEFLSEQGGGVDPLSVLLGAFAVIALLVTALVIANTFQVLVAQRTRELALLRSVGATTRQVRGSVLLEALLVGLLGSVVGALAALGLVWGVVQVIQRIPGFSMVAFGMSIPPLLITVAVGTLVAVVASVRPALAATRVSPLEAMRPVAEVSTTSRGGVVRIVIGALLALGGTTAMMVGVANGTFVLGIGGGALSFLGVLMLANLFVPLAVKAASVLARPAGLPGRLAGVNAVRHRSRTAATAAALLIGTTLVTLFVTGGRTAQHELDAMLGSSYPIDLVMTVQEDPDTAAETAGNVSGVEAASVLRPVGTIIGEDGTEGVSVYAGDADTLRTVLADAPEEVRAALEKPGVVFGPNYANKQLTVQGTQGGDAQLERVDLAGVEGFMLVTTEEAERQGWDVSSDAVAAPSADGTEGAPAAPTPPQLLLDLDNALSPQELSGTVEDITTATSAQQGTVVYGGAPMRSLYSTIINGILMVVVALLAVSVLIALIGVANTLSLSVIERTRENSLLRALGLTKRGMSSMIAIESVLISTVAAVLGCALGVFYGWAGSQLILGLVIDGMVPVTVPWLAIIGVVVIAAVAGLVASMLPTIRATRLSPVEGLATV